MKAYNPFEKGISELNAEDLICLRSVPESWYIEYKQEISKADAIAKSISAMANTYGGWIFYGIAEESKENSVAGDFLGIDRSEVDAGLQRIRQAIGSLLNPDCHYEAKALYGPCTEIGLSENRAIICVAVPQSIEAPHVHKKGVIYRRISDGSDPTPETDRHMIEKMFRRSDALLTTYKEWLDEDPELSEGEAGSPHIRLMISANPWRMPRSDFRLNIDSAREALGANGGNRTIPFDTFYTTSRGVIARQCSSSDPTYSRLTWNIYKSLSGDISIPLSARTHSISSLRGTLENYKIGDRLTDQLEKAQLLQAKLIDLNLVFYVVTGIIESQRALFKQAGWPCGFRVKVKILNAWRAIPFLDTDFFLSHVERNGIPICLTRYCVNPPGSAPDTFIHVPDNEAEGEEWVKVALQAFRVLIPIAEAFGIPMTDLLAQEPDGKAASHASIYESLMKAGKHSAALSPF